MGVCNLSWQGSWWCFVGAIIASRNEGIWLACSLASSVFSARCFLPGSVKVRLILEMMMHIISGYSSRGDHSSLSVSVCLSVCLSLSPSVSLVCVHVVCVWVCVFQGLSLLLWEGKHLERGGLVWWFNPTALLHRNEKYMGQSLVNLCAEVTNLLLATQCRHSAIFSRLCAHTCSGGSPWRCSWLLKMALIPVALPWAFLEHSNPL